MIRPGLLFLVASATLAAAEAPFLTLPLDCTLGTSCVIEDYVDLDPGSGSADYTCGLKSRDGHKGTDIALLDFGDMAAGRAVIAAASGMVDAVRDGMADTPVSTETRAAIAGRECGNAVRIDHGNGYKTIYCHMKRDSIRVAPNDRVARGDVLGEVGLSGLTNYPHLHLGVLRGDTIVDPFSADAEEDCTAPDRSLWIDTPAHTETGLFTAGFSDAVPDMEDVQTGAARRAAIGRGDAMVLYGHVFKARDGDVLEMRFSRIGETTPAPLTHRVTLATPSAQLFRAFGKRAPQNGWPPGDYRGYVTLRRDDAVIAVRHAEVTVE